MSLDFNSQAEGASTTTRAPQPPQTTQRRGRPRPSPSPPRRLLPLLWGAGRGSERGREALGGMRIGVMCAVACGRFIIGILSAHHRRRSERAFAAACFLPLSNPLPAAPVFRRGKHGGKHGGNHSSKRVAATARLCDDITNIPKARVAQRSDERCKR